MTADLLPDWHAEVLNITPSRLRQLVTHDPEQGLYGDCFRTTIACLIGASSPDDVPHFVADNINRDGDVDPKGWTDLAAAREWLRRIDLDLFPLSLDDADALGVHYKTTVDSPLGVKHSVVAQAGRVVWCPAGHDLDVLAILPDAGAWVVSRPWSPDPAAMVAHWRSLDEVAS